MNIFRSHITQFYGFVLLMVGIAFSYAKPIDQKENHTAFTHWLGTHLKDDNSEVQKELAAISSEHSEFESVLRKASVLVSSHSDDFEFPVSNKELSSEDIYQVLISTWNDYRNMGAGMGKAIFVESLKTQTILPNDGKIVISSTTNQRKTELKNPSTYLVNAENSLNLSFFLSPLESGTAIGAP